jgi:hypothetical protein
MSVIKTDTIGGKYVRGHTGTQYGITDQASIDHHIAMVVKNKMHGDLDLLLDAKLELEAEHAKC